MFLSYVIPTRFSFQITDIAVGCISLYILLTLSILNFYFILVITWIRFVVWWKICFPTNCIITATIWLVFIWDANYMRLLAIMMTFTWNAKRQYCRYSIYCWIANSYDRQMVQWQLLWSLNNLKMISLSEIRGLSQNSLKSSVSPKQNERFPIKLQTY